CSLFLREPFGAYDRALCSFSCRGYRRRRTSLFCGARLRVFLQLVRFADALWRWAFTRLLRCGIRRCKEMVDGWFLRFPDVYRCLAGHRPILVEAAGIVLERKMW